MPNLTEAIFGGKRIDINEALTYRTQYGKNLGTAVFRCPECGEQVRPHKSGGGAEAHFEHLARNPDCSLSHKARMKDSNPDWVRDELILALDVYLRHRPNPPAKTSEEINQLSRQLQSLAPLLFPHYAISDTFRNVNGVYMKLMNFRRLDSQYTSHNKSGLARGSKGDELVWEEFSQFPGRCTEVANAIIGSLENFGADGGEGSGAISEDIEEAPEGRLLTRTHLVRERDRKLVEAKRNRVLKKSGKLECVVCGFDFSMKYGEYGSGYIECHHTKPLASLSAGHKTHIDDLELVCSNCHRMIHRKRQWLSIAELKGFVRN
ncbi:HNH endonuclease [Propionivibrio sp.]|uniref:HNH endonuclease n=1 Tax=Propionivibrio sp. TaxID=2212460 RepID=UPI0039E29AF9